MASHVTTSRKTLSAVFDDLKPGSTNIDLADEATVAAEAKNQAGVTWTGTSSSLIPEVARLLDIPLPRLLVGFLEKADEITAALKESKASPDDTTDVSLFDSQTEASFDPFIEVRFNGVSSHQRIPVSIVLPLTFKGAILLIRNGEIVDALAGECTIEGRIKIGTVTVAKLSEPVKVTLGARGDAI